MAGSNCDVCGRLAETVVCCSQLGAISFAYCDSCMVEGLEPYDALPGLACKHKDLAEWAQLLVEKSCQKVGKTVQDYDDEIDRLDRDMADYFSDPEN